MAPTASPTRKPRENQYPFDLGVRGRKTGITVPDTGIRDEHGLEPMDHLFSSPEKILKSSKRKRNGSGKKVDADTTISSEEDMDMGESTIPEPTQVLTERKRASMRMPPPRSKSPIKTFLQSPARRHPSIGPVSSPTRGSVVTPGTVNPNASVNRRLNFSVDDLNPTAHKEASKSFPRKRNGLQNENTKSANAKLTNGTRLSPRTLQPAYRAGSDTEQAHEELQLTQDEPAPGNAEEDSYEIAQLEDQNSDQLETEYEGNIVPEVLTEPDIAEAPTRIPKKRGRPSIAKETAVKRGRGRPPRHSIEVPMEKEAEDEATEELIEEEEQAQRPTKRPRGRPKASEGKENFAKKESPKKRGPTAKKSNPYPAEISSPPEVQRGPPRPKHNRGLFILRRETPDDRSHTRSGRSVIKPLAFWKNETVVYGEDEEADGDQSFLVPVIKEVLRADEVEEPRSRRGPRKRSKPGIKSRRRIQESEAEDEEDLAEPWESEPGRIYGETRVWNPDDQVGEDSDEKQIEIALSSAAIITREIPGATFKFAKTLTLPFFGSGMVDLPPGAIKKPKNSRRMQMAFFVFSGRVNVTVNDNAFRIGKGGMWQVPRGNFYSIENDYEKPARIFFAQGCEVQEAVESA